MIPTILPGVFGLLPWWADLLLGYALAYLAFITLAGAYLGLAFALPILPGASIAETMWQTAYNRHDGTTASLGEELFTFIAYLPIILLIFLSVSIMIRDMERSIEQNIAEKIDQTEDA